MEKVRIKLKILADAAKYDASCASSGARRKGTPDGIGHSDGTGICHSYTPDGRCVSLLKILLTNYCIYDCQYCINRVSSDVERARFGIDEVVNLTLDFYRRNYIEGLFLSSGIIQSPDYTMEQLAEVARRLREVHKFNGYIHLKAVPGASAELIQRAGRHADRLSANVELPREQDLQRLAPEKRMADVHATMGTIRGGIDEAAGSSASRFVPSPGGGGGGGPGPGRPGSLGRPGTRAPLFAPAGQSTQLIVGASDATDRDTLHTAVSLYRRHRLRRVYYTAFSPIPHADPRLPPAAPPMIREHRLYQADWLVRKYGFEPGELLTPEQPHLDMALDPKHAWALSHREFFPVDVNRGDREALLRVPGIGTRSVGRIVASRRWRSLRLADLRRLKVALKRAQPFIITADHHPAATLDSEALPGRARRVNGPREEQLTLFSAAGAALTGEL